MKDELELSIKDLFLKILLRWRLIIVCMLIGGVTFGVLGAWKNTKIQVVEEVETIDQLNQKKENLENQLTEADKVSVIVAVAENNSYQEQAKYLEEYLDNSILMKINSNAVPTMKQMYQIVTNSMSAEECNAIARAYAWEIDSTETYNKIIQELNLNPNLEYAKELIKISEVVGGVFTVSVSAVSTEQCQQIFNIIEEQVAISHQEIKAVYKPFDFIAPKVKYSYEISDAVLTKQRSARTTFLGINGKVQMLDDNFNQEQLSYYNTLLKLEKGVTEIEYREDSLETLTKTSLINKKFILVGALVGMLFPCFFVTVKYVFSSKLRKKDDLELVLGIPTIAVICNQKSQKKFLNIVDRLIYMVFNGRKLQENNIESICVNIKKIAQRNNYKKVYLVGTHQTVEIEAIKVEICEFLKNDLEMKNGSFNENDVRKFEELVDSDMVILFEETGFSSHTNIQRVIDMCDLHKIAVGGSVVFESY